MGIHTATLALDEITVDAELQARDGQLDPATVETYAEAYTDGEALPPIDVYHDGQAYYLADGFHRYAGKRLAGDSEVRAKVYPGGRKDALLHACGANAKHGLRRTRADKRRAVYLAIEALELKSDRAVAKACNVSHTFVAKLRREISSAPAAEPDTAATNAPPPDDLSHPAAASTCAKCGQRKAEHLSLFCDQCGSDALDGEGPAGPTTAPELEYNRHGSTPPKDDGSPEAAPSGATADTHPERPAPEGHKPEGAGRCCKGGDHEYETDADGTYCRKCLEPAPSGNVATCNGCSSTASKDGRDHCLDCKRVVESYRDGYTNCGLKERVYYELSHEQDSGTVTLPAGQSGNVATVSGGKLLPDDVLPCPMCNGAGHIKRDARLPDNLQGEAFIEAWQEWQLFRVQKRQKLTTVGMSRQLQKLSRLGEVKAIEAINHSIEQGYTGLYHPTESKGRPTNGNGHATNRGKQHPRTPARF